MAKRKHVSTFDSVRNLASGKGPTNHTGTPTQLTTMTDDIFNMGRGKGDSAFDQLTLTERRKVLDAISSLHEGPEDHIALCRALARTFVEGQLLDLLDELDERGRS